jgi:Na+-transporting NADH:ubiquinone oxidoreductase subunit NqrA
MYSQKDRLHVLILSRGLEVRGDLHVLAGSRLTDALNSKGKDFLPITDATISVIGAPEPLRELKYIAVNRDSIDCIMEIDAE